MVDAELDDVQRQSKSGSSERGAGFGMGRAEQLAAGSGGLCSSDFSPWVTSREDAEKLVFSCLKRKSKSQGGSQLPLLQWGADSSVGSGMEALVVPGMGLNAITCGEKLLRLLQHYLVFLICSESGIKSGGG